MNNNLKKSYFWNTIGSGINSFNSLFFLIIVTRINGLTNAGMFTFSFATASMLYIIASYSGRTYQVTETIKDIGDNEFIFHRFISSTIMIIVSILFCIINGYSLYKATIFLLLCMFRCVEAISDVFHGILQKNNRLDIVGKSLTVRGFLNLFIFFVSNIISRSLIFSCILIILVDIIILLFVDIKYSKKLKQKNKSLNYSSVLKIFMFGFSTFGFTFIANYLVNAPRYAIDSMLNEEFQTIFGIIVMPATIIMLANQFVIQPIITMLKDSYINGEKKRFLHLIYTIIGITILIGGISIFLAYFLGIPVLNILYNIELNNYLYNLLFILIGATLYTISIVLSNALIIFRKTKFQLLIYIVTSIIAFILSNKLTDLFGFNGATYSYLIIMSVLLILYIVYFLFVINNKDIWNKKTKK